MDRIAEGQNQLRRFGAYLEKLSDFPDKDLINQLTMSAQLTLRALGEEGAQAVVGAMTQLLASPSNGPERKVPLFYALDSILKNVGGLYITLFSHKVLQLYSSAFEVAIERDRTRLHRLLLTWQDKQIFAEHLPALNDLTAPWLKQAQQSYAQTQQQQQAAARQQAITTAALVTANAAPTAKRPRVDDPRARGGCGGSGCGGGGGPGHPSPHELEALIVQEAQSMLLVMQREMSVQNPMSLQAHGVSVTIAWEPV